MSKKMFTLLLAAGIAVVFTASAIQAGTASEEALTAAEQAATAASQAVSAAKQAEAAAKKALTAAKKASEADAKEVKATKKEKEPAKKEIKSDKNPKKSEVKQAAAAVSQDDSPAKQATSDAAPAKTTADDVITMKSKLLDATRKKSPDAKKPCQLVQFPHKMHYTKNRLACGACHHDKAGKPLADLKEGDSVQKCEVCHTHVKPGEKTFQGKYKKKPVDIMHLTSAIHENCIGCHNEKGVKSAKKCNDCHKKM